MVTRQDASTGQVVVEKDKNTGDEFAPVDGRQVMGLKIYSPFKVYYDDTAFSISALNDTGPFDILPKHHNFISLLNACELAVQAPHGNKRIRISGGLMHVQANHVRVFLDV